jgi:hypothetical protein
MSEGESPFRAPESKSLKIYLPLQVSTSAACSHLEKVDH